MWTVKKQRNEIQFPAVFLKWLSSPDRLGKCKISRVFFRWKWVKKIIQVHKKNNHQRKGDRQNRAAKLHFRKVKSFNRVDRSFTTYQTSLKSMELWRGLAYKRIWILSKVLLTSVSRLNDRWSLENKILFYSSKNVPLGIISVIFKKSI